MCVRVCYYLACTNCNNQFRDPQYGCYFSSEEEVKEQARTRGWKIDELVENGSHWDFCPRCAKENPEL